MVSLETVFNVFLFTFIGSILSLLGGLILLRRQLWEGEHGVHLLAFAAGVLLVTAFWDLLPEAVHESGDDPNVFLAALLGVVVFFFLEKLLVNFHPHSENEQETKEKTLVSLILFGDGFHNFIDGFVIATSFLVSVPLGIVTSLAVAAHEIPQEISDFTILLRSNLGVKKAITFNVLSGLTALIGAGIALFFAETIEPYLGLTLAFTAGMFIYISAAGVLLELNHLYLKERHWHQLVFFVIGLLVMFFAIQYLHPDHEHHDSDTSHESEEVAH